MKDDERLWIVNEALFAHVKSHSQRHIRDPYQVVRLAQEIIRRIDLGTSMWRKWTPQRELLVKSSIPVPPEAGISMLQDPAVLRSARRACALEAAEARLPTAG